MRTFEFTKAQALGNDFIIIDDIAGGFPPPDAAFIKEACDRRLGIGADGILLLSASTEGAFKMRTLNSDGSEAEMCGNGVRCAAKYAFDNGLCRDKNMIIETAAGLRTVSIETDGAGKAKKLRVGLGEPRSIETAREISVAGRTFAFTAVSMGNPHAVIFVDDLTSIDLAKYGPAIETNERFPNKTNVEFARVISVSEIEMRVWERGAGETMACGTGAAAVLAAAATSGLAGRAGIIKLAGGDLEVDWSENGEIYISGSAELVYRGTTKAKDGTVG